MQFFLAEILGKEEPAYIPALHNFVSHSKVPLGNSLAIQWLGLHAFTTEGPGSIPGWGTGIPQATRRSQKKKKKVKVPPPSPCPFSHTMSCNFLKNSKSSLEESSYDRSFQVNPFSRMTRDDPRRFSDAWFPWIHFPLLRFWAFSSWACPRSWGFPGRSCFLCIVPQWPGQIR